MNKAGIIFELNLSHQEFWNSGEHVELTKQNVSFNGKWSALQNIQHINLSIAPIARFLKTDKQILQSKFGMANRPSGDYETTAKNYIERLSKGVVTTEAFTPQHSTGSIKNEIENGQVILKEINSALENWTEEELDKQLCPHPRMGNLTMREMLYFCIIHAKHHQKAIEKIN